MMKLYYFTDSNGKVYYGKFESVDDARYFAYVFGYCFCGRVIL